MMGPENHLQEVISVHAMAFFWLKRGYIFETLHIDVKNALVALAGKHRQFDVFLLQTLDKNFTLLSSSEGS